MSTYKPHNTAIARTKASKTTCYIKELTDITRHQTILDYGCGKGEDVKFYSKLGFDAQGYDPFPGFGFDKKPERLFDIVVVNYVLNVIPWFGDRMAVIKEAQKYLRPGGLLIVAARSDSEIKSQAKKGNWPQHKDGFWSNEKRGMFQVGLTEDELLETVDMGMSCLTMDVVKLGSDTSCIMVVKDK